MVSRTAACIEAGKRRRPTVIMNLQLHRITMAVGIRDSFGSSKTGIVVGEIPRISRILEKESSLETKRLEAG